MKPFKATYLAFQREMVEYVANAGKRGINGETIKRLEEDVYLALERLEGARAGSGDPRQFPQR